MKPKEQRKRFNSQPPQFHLPNTMPAPISHSNLTTISAHRTSNRSPGDIVILQHISNQIKQNSEPRTHHMITHRNKKIKKELPPLLHLRLHSPTPHESRPRPNNKRQIMRPQLRLRIRRIRIRKPRTRKNSTTLNPRMQSLFPQRQPLQSRQTVFLRRTTRHHLH